MIVACDSQVTGNIPGKIDIFMEDLDSSIQCASYDGDARTFQTRWIKNIR